MDTYIQMFPTLRLQEEFLLRTLSNYKNVFIE